MSLFGPAPLALIPFFHGFHFKVSEAIEKRLKFDQYEFGVGPVPSAFRNAKKRRIRQTVCVCEDAAVKVFVPAISHRLTAKTDDTRVADHRSPT
jgi:hypothetical protein